MDTQFFITYLEPVLTFIVGGGITGLVTARYTRKTAKADAMKAVQDVYQETIQDLRSDRDIMKQEKIEMREQISSLEKQVLQNCKDINELKAFKCVDMNCKKRKKEL